MKLLIIRHGDPDYAIDSLTKKGWREAEYLAKRLEAVDVKDFYISPLGRARDTASCTLDKLGRTAKQKEWLREFAPKINRPDTGKCKKVVWDWLPQDWTVEESFFQEDGWYNVPVMQEAHVKEEYEWVVKSFDELLAEYGYCRAGRLYRVEQANEDTLVFFCHFGVECVLLSHLMNVSPMILWHGLCAAPTSVTTVVTEERRKGIASFRVSSFADISHLYAKGEPPAFAARFCETYDSEERHD